ncbi:MAG: HAD-IIB family hydrolase [Candidatus Yanofskybacteria bacterium]|nr:HAD-IIB family hydrolase [Candidatus Yanofskybacteria bacterium]
MENLINTINKVPRDKKLIIFDLDGTLAESKGDIDEEMAGLLKRLLEKRQVAVIGGGKYELFQSQLVEKLEASEESLKNLFLFPTTSTSFYRYNAGKWECVYSMKLSPEEKLNVLDAFDKAFSELNYEYPEKIIHPDIIEDRGSEITFSALGQHAPLALKEEWKKEHTDFKLKLVEILQKYLPEMEVRAAGFTSIDITRKGIDKEYGIKQIEKYLNVPIGDMLFVGDALFLGGNDSAALRAGVLCFEVRGVEDTKKLIEYLLTG